MPQEKTPAVQAPWPPDPAKDPKGRKWEPRIVGNDPKESFYTIAAEKQLDPLDLVEYNFRTRNPKEINWYLRQYVGCFNATRDGQNYTFYGAGLRPSVGDPMKTKATIFIPVARPGPRRAPQDRGELVQWFIQEILPERTIGVGTVLVGRGNKVLDRLLGGGSDPNGICGAVADYVMEQYQNFGGGVALGYILWRKGHVFTHVANVHMPVSSVLVYEGSDHSSVSIPETTIQLPFEQVAQWTVLDLYFKKVATVENWWRDVSYMGWGQLVLDPDGVYINS